MRMHKVLDNIRDTKVSIKVIVSDVKREFTFNIVLKTRIKELCNRICQLLDIDPLRSDIFLYGNLGLHELNPSSTLAQNDVTNGTVLQAKINYTGYGSKINTFYKIITKKQKFGEGSPQKYVDEDKYPVYSLKTQNEMVGLKIRGCCQNKDCIAYNREVTFPLGAGTFPVNTVLTNTKCQTCPYKDKDLQKPIVCKGVILVNCYWKIEGHYFDSNGFYNFKYMKNFIKTEGADGTIFYEKLKDYNYINPVLTVKEL